MTVRHNDLKFFTNEPDRDLYTRFSNILRSNTQFFDILVGYFRTSGFFKLADAMKDVEKIRILVGLNVDKLTVDIIDKATIKESKDAFISAIEKEFEESEASSEIEKGIHIFIDWLKSGKLEMRMYTEQPIHAKVYIMRKDPIKVPDMYGSVITGSSNFSEAGLINNLEFNVELKDANDVHFALEKFEELWNKGVPITSEYIEAVEQKTWIRNDITPYQIYLKTLYEFFKEEINADKEVLDDDLFAEGYMHLRYQKDAVLQAKKIVEAYNGVFISDVVGLGKTYICTMLAKILKKGKKLVICPPVLIENWQRALEDFDVAARVESAGKLEKLLDEGVEQYKYIIIDEAHRFRNDVTNSYEMLHKICHGKKVILVSATPINNYSRDIENQLSLFQSKHDSTIVGVKDLEGFFRSLRSKESVFEKGTPEFIEQQRKNSEEIRDKILRHIMIRRTRGEIRDYYADDMEKQGLFFPKLGSPIPIEYTFDEITDSIFKETVGIIKTFRYSRYKPLTYLIKPTPELNTMMAAQHNMGGFMKSILVKRLESSFYAFKLTLGRFRESYEKFISMYEKGDIWISKKLNVFDLLENDNLEKLIEAEKNEDAMHFKKADFNENFLKDLKWDLNKLRYLENIWEDVTTDPKLEEFIVQLNSDNRFANNKKIIFTESRETAEYLGDNLKEVFGERVVVYSGSSSQHLKLQIEDSFNPKYKHKNKDRYDILITTDILAEGVNLHRANALVNYDLPWNPTRIMQRVGRINRVGTEHDEIYVYNFFPTAQSSQHMPLKERILEKLQAFHDTLGEDYKYLSDDEEVTSQGLFDALNQDLDVDDEGSNPELAYLAHIRKIRDEDSELFETIKKLPKKAKTGRLSDKVKDDSTISFIRKGALKTFFIADGVNTKQISFLEAVKFLECESDEKKISIGESFYNHYEKNNISFDETLLESEVITSKTKTTNSSNDKAIIKMLKALRKVPTFTDDQEEIINKMINLFEEGSIPGATSKKIVKEIKKYSEPIQIFKTIEDHIDDTYFENKKYSKGNIDGEKQVILSCFMKESK